MKQSKGFVLVMALLIVGVVAVMVAGSLVLSVTNQRINRNDALTSQVTNVAQGANAYWKAELVSLYQFMSNNFDMYAAAINKYEENGGVISCGNYFAIGVDLDRNGAIEIANPGTLPQVSIPIGSNTGTAVVTFSVEGSAIRLESKAEYQGANATVIEEFNISNVDIWNNAVFAESSAANATIQGRAEIRGAVHLLGTGAGSTDTVLDLTGSFGMGNTYKGLSPSLGVNSDEMRLSNDDPEDLCATLRVRAGQVELGGSAQVGYDEGKNPDPYVDNLRGVYTNHGFKGTATEGGNIFSENGKDAAYDAGDSFDFPELNDPVSATNSTKWRDYLLDNSLVLSLNNERPDDRNLIAKGSNLVKGNATYALSNDCYLPLFGTTPPITSNPSPPPFTLTTLRQGVAVAGLISPALTQAALPALSTFATHKTGHPKNNGNGGQGGGSNGGGNGGNSGSSGGSSGGSAAGFSLVHDSTPNFRCAKTKTVNGVTEVLTEVRWFNNTHPDPAIRNTLYVGGTTGVVSFYGGDLTITGGNGQREIGYKGNGVLFTEEDSSGVGGNTILEIDFVPAAGKVPELHTSGAQKGVLKDIAPTTGLTNSYPNTSLLGIVARNQFQSVGSQKRFTLAIYAEETVSISKQTLIAGAIVTKKFDAGSNVPTVLYVPNLSERLSRFMPGAGGSGFAVSNVAWSRSY